MPFQGTRHSSCTACHSSGRRKITSPKAAAATAPSSTAPAATSFTSRIMGLGCFWAKLHKVSTPVLAASSPVTRPMAPIRQAHSPRERGSCRPKYTT